MVDKSMARQFILESKDIIKIDKAYLDDMLCFDNLDKNIDFDQLYKISGNELKHIQILRYKKGDSIIINNMQCNIIYISKEFAIINKIKDVDENGVPNINLTLYPAFLKSDKMDYLVQKSVELGVKSITPFFSRNTIVKLDDKSKIKRKNKLNKIALEAIKQCGRTDNVNVNQFISFKNMLNIIFKHDFCIFAYENEKENIKKVIDKLKLKNDNYNDIAIIVGPEGGFDNFEVEQLKQISNVYTVGLGQRILRAETANLNLISIIMYEFDN